MTLDNDAPTVHFRKGAISMYASKELDGLNIYVNWDKTRIIDVNGAVEHLALVKLNDVANQYEDEFTYMYVYLCHTCAVSQSLYKWDKNCMCLWF